MSKSRLLTSLFIVLALVGTMFTRLATNAVFDVVFGVMAVLACVEVSRVAYSANKINNAYIAATYPATLYLITMLFVYGKITFSYYVFAYLMMLIGYFVLTFVLTLATKNYTIDEMAKVGYRGKLVNFALDKSMCTLALLAYPATLFMALIFINYFDKIVVVNKLVGSNMLSWFMLTLTFAITMVCDSMAMVVGITFKGKKLCPNISPNKTISGAIGGLVGGMVSATIVYYLFTLSGAFVADFSAIGGTWWHILIIGFLGAIISQIGDILASLLKRRAGVKDYGNVFPGHGGVMDRVDGLIFNAAFILIYFILLAIF